MINAGESFGHSKRGNVLVSTEQTELREGFFRAGENPAPGRYVVLTVSDNGSGMDQETQGRIFEPFFTTKFAGRGLGLSAVHGILRSHGGYLRLESAPNAGTTFQVYFPASKGERAATGKAGKASSPDVDVRATILFADDEPVIRLVESTLANPDRKRRMP